LAAGWDRMLASDAPGNQVMLGAARSHIAVRPQKRLANTEAD